MKKIILIVVGIILVAFLGRLGWAFWQVKSEEVKIVTTPATTATTILESPIPVVPTETTSSSKVVVFTPASTISPKINIKSGANLGVDLCVGKDGIGTVAPLDQSKVIRDPDSGVQLVKDQILLVFKNRTPRNVVDMKISSINGIMVGCLADMDDYQVMINGNPTLAQMNVIIDQLNKDPLIDSASFNTLSSNF